MEIGNLIFGNSRGNYEIPRELVDSKAWNDLLKILHMDNYGIMNKNQNFSANEYGGYTCKDKNNKILFDIFPYWWNGCTCEAEEKNNEIYNRIKRKYISDVEENDYYALMMSENELTNQQKTELKRLEHIFDEIKQEFDEKSIFHKKDCLEIRHNFLYKPGTEDEFWIDWYKYPFRDSYMSKDLKTEEIENIFNDCIKILQDQLKEIK